ncbi:uncharacterized protein LOC123525900 [Mercenaria mercenaria]|uniref:uncharacterized protein LOC123525900 n=1 Tax=Mercenaria mercenaria TaxID=6596 RepID=UPI00234E589B|nr:uncharacterized protein LOC123525900 [Mercenaria mercenaria]
MKIAGQVSLILFLLVSSTHTVWRKKVCNLGRSCLRSYPCMEEFLRCDCIPPQFAGQNFEDLCWTSLAYEVGAPICCVNIEKRQETSRMLSNAGINNGDLLMSVLRSTVQKRNNIQTGNTILNNDVKSKPKDYRTKMTTSARSKHKNVMLKPRKTSVPKSIFVSTDDTSWTFPQQKVVTEFINTLLHAGKELDGKEMDNAYQGFSHKSLFTDVGYAYINPAVEPGLTESADIYPLQKETVTDKDNAYLNPVPISDSDNRLQSSHQNTRGRNSENTFPNNLQISSLTDHGNSDLQSVQKISEINKHNLMQNRILNALKCRTDRK